MRPNEFIGFFERATNPSSQGSSSRAPPTSPPTSPSPPEVRTDQLRDEKGITFVKEQRKAQVRRWRQALRKVIYDDEPRGGPKVVGITDEIRRERRAWKHQILAMGGSKREAEAGISDRFRELVVQVGGAL
jgi:hypothetical protein